ncbi:hypothetical protein FRC06_005380 [Ceratobasidium sp. 370]|nr:hypothetical protein FRC06_005380 [Ceratobasidium sp. 370]
MSATGASARHRSGMKVALPPLPLAKNQGNPASQRLVDIVDDVNPRGTEAWKVVAKCLQVDYPDPPRDRKACKKCFQDLLGMKLRTGNPKINEIHKYTLQVAAQHEVMNTVDTINDKRGPGTAIANANEDVDKDKDGQDEEDRGDEGAETAGGPDVDNTKPVSGSSSPPAPLPSETVPKPAAAAPPTPAHPPLVPGAITNSARPSGSTKATPSTAKQTLANKWKGKLKEEIIELPSDSPDRMIDIESDLKPRKRTAEAQGGRVVQKKPMYEPKLVASSQGCQLATELTVDWLLDAVKPEVAQDATALKQANTLNNIVLSDRLHELGDLKSELAQAKQDFEAEQQQFKGEPAQAKQDLNAEWQQLHIEFKLSMTKILLQTARAYGPAILNTDFGVAGAPPTQAQALHAAPYIPNFTS